MWGAEPDIHVQLIAELLEAGHLASQVVSQARSQEGRNVLHLPHDSFKGFLGRAPIHLAQDHEAGLSLGEHADGGAVIGALDEIAFPVPWYWLVLNLGRMVLEAQLLRHEAAF